MGDRSGKQTIRMGADGLPLDDVSHYPASPEVLQGFDDVAQDLYKLRVPVLLDLKDPHAHLMTILPDGTGNDADQDPLHKSNVAKFGDQIENLKESGFRRIHVEYIAGPGTQINRFENLTDNIIGHTSEARAEELYWRVVRSAQPIFQTDPDAKLSFLVEGFSRGGSEVPLLTQMLDERGIPNLNRPVLVADALGNMVETFPHFHQAPGVGPIAIFTYDPVPTGALQMVDRRLPSSVVTGVQLNSSDLRGTFRVDMQMPHGFSEDGRFYSSPFLKVAHSDIGGTYLRNATGAHAFNIATDFHNALLSEPLFLRQHVTDDPRMNVVHRSVEGELVYRFLPKVDRSLPEGQISTLAPEYWRVARPGEVVNIPAQAPAPMDERFRPLLQSARPVAPSPLAPEPTVPAGEAMLERVTQDKNVTLEPYRPPVSKLAMGLTGLGVAATGYDVVQSGRRAMTLDAQGNPLAAQSEMTHMVARNVGGWVGGAAMGAAVGWETGPGVIAFAAVGAISTSAAGEKIADWWDDRRIYTQTDRDGVNWQFNSRQWLRQAQADLTQDSADNPQKQAFAALPDKANELNYRATLAAVDLAAREAPAPRDPYRLPASDSDRHSLRPADWMHDPQNGHWHRNVAVGLERSSDRMIYAPEIASPQRAAELDQLSAEVIAANIANGPAARAARVDMAYRLNGWETVGPLPTNLQTALSDVDTLTASDGKEYQRSADGGWRRNGALAEGNLKLELEATRSALQPALARHAEAMAAVQPQAAPSQQEKDRDDLAATYASYGIAPNDNTPLEAVLLAVQRTRDAHGIDAATTALAPQLSAEGRYDVNSPLAHLRTNANGVIEIAAVTSAEDIRRAVDEVQARGQGETAPAQIQPSPTPPSAAMPETPTAPQATPAPDPTITALQAGLIQLGYQYRISQPLQANGVNDAATQQAVTAFQAKNDLPISGIADQATQQAMQQALLAQQLQQQAVETRGREQERKAEQDPLDRNGSRDHAGLQPFSNPDHPQHALYADVQQRFQAKGHTLSEEQLSALAAQMHTTGMTPDWRGDVTVLNGKAFAMAAWPPGMRADLDLTTPAPSVQETMKDFQAETQRMAQNMERLNQQQTMAQEHGHGLNR
jgi:hypothetical protein